VAAHTAWSGRGSLWFVHRVVLPCSRGAGGSERYASLATPASIPLVGGMSTIGGYPIVYQCCYLQRYMELCPGRYLAMHGSRWQTGREMEGRARGTLQGGEAAVELRGELGEKADPSTERAVRTHTAAFLAKQAANDGRQQRAYLDALGKRGTQSAGLAAARVGRETLWRWREHSDAFVQAEAAARETLADQLEQEAIRRAYHGVQRPVYQQGQLVGYVTDFSDAVLMMLLKAARPDKYREKADVSVALVVKTLAGLDPREVL
jgi:hypothetical protein